MYSIISNYDRNNFKIKNNMAQSEMDEDGDGLDPNSAMQRGKEGR